MLIRRLILGFLKLFDSFFWNSFLMSRFLEQNSKFFGFFEGNCGCRCCRIGRVFFALEFFGSGFASSGRRALIFFLFLWALSA